MRGASEDRKKRGARWYETALTSLSLKLARTGCGAAAAENPLLEPLERLRVLALLPQ
jgi:hypothetical protein